MSDEFEDLRVMLFESMPDRLEVLQSGYEAILNHEKSSPQSLCQSLEPTRICLHNLAGLGGSIGLQNLTDLARPVEQQIVALASIGNTEDFYQAVETARLSLLDMIGKVKCLPRE